MPAIPAESLAVQELHLGALPDSELTGSQAWLGEKHVLIVPDRGAIVVRISLTTPKVDTIGRDGEGPGEFRYATSTWMRGDTTYVYDRATSRIQGYDSTGKVLGEYRLPVVPGFVAGGRDRWDVARVGTPEQFGVLLNPKGFTQGATLKNRKVERAPESADFTVAGGKGRYFVYESSAALLYTVDSAGQQLFPPAELPEWLALRLKKYFREMISGAGPGEKTPDIAGRPLVAKIKNLTGDGQGRAVIFFVTSDPADGYAVRFDPEKAAFTRLGYPADSGQRDALRKSFGSSSRDSLIVVTRLDGTRLFVIK